MSNIRLQGFPKDFNCSALEEIPSGRQFRCGTCSVCVCEEGRSSPARRRIR
jgi:hypothetical protein